MVNGRFTCMTLLPSNLVRFGIVLCLAIEGMGHEEASGTDSLMVVHSPTVTEVLSL